MGALLFSRVIVPYAFIILKTIKNQKQFICASMEKNHVVFLLIIQECHDAFIIDLYIQ